MAGAAYVLHMPNYISYTTPSKFEFLGFYIKVNWKVISFCLSLLHYKYIAGYYVFCTSTYVYIFNYCFVVIHRFHTHHRGMCVFK